MGLHHPYEKLADESLRRALVASVLISAFLGIIVLWASESGPGTAAFSSLVLAGTPERAAEVLSSWTPTDRILIGFVSGFDFLFGIAWTNMMALGCVWASTRWQGAAGVFLGPFLAWCSWIALLLDIPENASYLIMVLGTVDQPWPLISSLAVYPRIAVFLAGLAFIASALAKTLLVETGRRGA